jgi:hypothetical protein
MVEGTAMPLQSRIGRLRITAVRRAAIASLSGVALAATAGAASGAPVPVPPQNSAPARFLQEIPAFDNAEAAIFSDDGRYVFVSNSAELGQPKKGLAWSERKGFISKMAVRPNGTLRFVKRRLITGLTAPLGMAVNTVATTTFPKGTIFVMTGGLPLYDSSGRIVKSPSRLTSKIVAFDVDGKILGEIPWNAGSVLAGVTGAPATLPNAAAFDAEGNLYLSDTGFGAKTVKPAITARPGVVMVPHESIDALAAGGTPTNLPKFISMPGGPDGIDVSPIDGTIHVNTVGDAVGLPDLANGGLYRLTKADFLAGRLPKPFAKNLGALDGLTFTKLGTRIDTQILADPFLTTVASGSNTVRSLRIKGLKRTLSGPADIAVFTRPNGTSILVIPELLATSPNRNRNTMVVARLPKGL